MVLNLFKFLGAPDSSRQIAIGRVKPVTKDNIKRDWQNIDLLLKGKQPSQLRQALITADKCLDNALRDVVPGEKMGERLKNVRPEFEYSVYDKLWKAHKVRNSIVHEAGFEPPYHMVQKSVDDLKKGLAVLGVKV